MLGFAGVIDVGAHGGGGFGFFGGAEFFVRDGGDFYLDIDAVEQRSADLAEVALDDGWSAAAFAGGIAVEAAGAGVHGGDVHEAGGEVEGHAGARDTHD